MRNRRLQRSTKQKSKLAVLGFVVFVCFVLATIVLTIQTASVGATISDLEEKETALAKVNRELEGELVVHQSVQKLDLSAEDLGFGEAEDIIYFSHDSYVAQLR